MRIAMERVERKRPVNDSRDKKDYSKKPKVDKIHKNRSSRHETKKVLMNYVSK